MKQQIQNVLQVSARLYELLGTPPKDDNRETYIEKVNELLDQRGLEIDKLQQLGFTMDTVDNSHTLMAELDKGIIGRLNSLMDDIKKDMKNLQISKKNEQQYMNPYSDVRVMDGMYYDKKK